MKRLKEILLWLESHYDFAYALVRIFLGVALFVRGVIFFTDSAVAAELAGPQNVGGLVPFIAVIHIVGGLMLVAGLLTQLAALVQIPVLLGAVFLIHFQQGLLATGQSLELSVLVLFLLAVFALFGSGPLSVDQHLKPPTFIPERLGGRYDIAYAYVRIFLGIALFVRSLFFGADSSAVAELTASQNVGWLYTVALIHYIIIAHMMGGIILAGGLLTRLAALVQIPVLLGAVFLIHFQQGLLATGQSLELSVLVLFLLAVFALFGSGPLSVDRYTPAEEVQPEPVPVEPMRPSATTPLPQTAPGGTATLAPPARIVRRPVLSTNSVPQRTAVRRQVGIGGYLISLAVALPFFLYRGATFVMEPNPPGTSTLILIADWVLSYFFLPFFLAFVAVWVFARLRYAFSK